ncbi:MAG: RNA polymerase sigma factor, partial [Mariniphaga sp.]
LYHISFTKNGEFVSMKEQLMVELEEIISEMPEKCQTAFRLKWFEEKKVREIAEIMNISTTMVDKHLARGLEIARKKLQKIKNQNQGW